MGEKISLVCFTLLSQSAIGLAVVAQLLGGGYGLQRAAILWIVLLIALSQGVSLLHLGTPLGAYRAAFNIKSSWLSREIFLLVAFFALSSIRLYFQCQGAESLASNIGWPMMIVGCLCLYSMASAYVKTEFPAWTTSYTHIAFYTTAIALGAALYAVIAAQTGFTVSGSLTNKAFALAAAAVAVQMVGFAAYLPALAGRSGAGRASVRLLAGMTLPIVVSHVCMLIGGFVFPGLAYAQMGSGGAPPWVYAAFVLMVIGQSMARYIFYASGVHNMPDAASVSCCR